MEKDRRPKEAHNRAYGVACGIASCSYLGFLVLPLLPIFGSSDAFGTAMSQQDASRISCSMSTAEMQHVHSTEGHPMSVKPSSHHSSSVSTSEDRTLRKATRTGDLRGSGMCQRGQLAEQQQLYRVMGLGIVVPAALEFSSG